MGRRRARGCTAHHRSPYSNLLRVIHHSPQTTVGLLEAEPRDQRLVIARGHLPQQQREVGIQVHDLEFGPRQQARCDEDVIEELGVAVSGRGFGALLEGAPCWQAAGG